MRVKLLNFLNSITSFLRNDATAPRVWQLQDRDGTIQDETDIAELPASNLFNFYNFY